MDNKKVIIVLMIGILLIVAGLLVISAKPRSTDSTLNPTPTITATPSPTPIPEAYSNDDEVDDDLEGLIDHQKEIQEDQNAIEELINL